jgi:alpha-tubulin suppressor-like RCC1 family protein
VQLINQFSPSGFVPSVGAVDLHCNPAQKTVSGRITRITNPNAHLLCWRTTAVAQPARTVVVSNQFGRATLTTGQPGQLCLPSWKSVTGRPNLTPVVPPGLNHFTCYSVAYAPGSARFRPPASVTVKDQFSSRPVAVKVGVPKLLCLPTTTILNGVITYPRLSPTHLLCFNVSPTPTKNPVYDENDFLDEKINILRTNLLCVPSTKALARNVTAITTGDHTCALINGGTLKCWGYNGGGQLGIGTRTGPQTCGAGFICSASAVPVIGLGGTVTAVTAGQFHTCALMVGGTAKCWGDGTTGSVPGGSTTPVSVGGLNGTVTAIAAGLFNTCALIAGGTVQCWGDNAEGELGNATTTSSETPTNVVGLDGPVTQLTSAGEHTCALIAGGTVQCWGGNFFGQLGDGTNTGPDTCSIYGPCSTKPEDVSGLGGTVIAVSAGIQHTCALMTGGTVKCWGGNSGGQLGTGVSGGSSLTPVSVTGLNGAVAAIAANQISSCALIVGGTVQCWGDDTFGELGDNGTPGPNNVNSPTPVNVVGLNGTVVAISAGGNASCALIVGGTVQCWGENDGGNLGNGDTNGPQVCASGIVCSMKPVTVIGL